MSYTGDRESNSYSCTGRKFPQKHKVGSLLRYFLRRIKFRISEIRELSAAKFVYGLSARADSPGALLIFFHASLPTYIYISYLDPALPYSA